MSCNVTHFRSGTLENAKDYSIDLFNDDFDSMSGPQPAIGGGNLYIFQGVRYCVVGNFHGG